MRLLYWCRQGETNVITSFVEHSTLTDKQDVPFLHYSQRIIKQNNWKWQNYYQKLLDDIFFLGSIFCLSPSQEASRFIKSLAKGHFFCHPLHLEVIIWSNVISGLAYKQQYRAIENLNQEIWGERTVLKMCCAQFSHWKNFKMDSLSFIWNRRRQNDSDFMLKESKSRNTQIRIENRRKLD